jgi:hypothetical protein
VSPDGVRVYAAGAFNTINGVSRFRFGAIRTSDGGTEAWSPTFNNGAPSSITVAGSVVYAAGGFSVMGGQSRNGAAALSAVEDAGNVLPWNPTEPPGDIRFIVAAVDGVFMAGQASVGASDFLPSSRLAFYPIVYGGSPVAPVGIAAHVRGDVVEIAWRPPLRGARPSAYALFAGASPGVYSVAPGIPVGNVLRFVNSGTPAGTFFVRAATSGGPRSHEVGLTVGGGCSGAPQPPLELRVNVIAGNDVSLSWSAPPGRGPFSYRLEALLDPQGSPVAVLPVSGTDFITSAPSGLYYVRIVTVTACGTSAPSSVVTLPIATSALPSPPDLLTAAVTGSTVNLSWGPPASGPGVAIYVIEAGSAPNLRNLAVLPVAGTSFFAGGVPPGVYYVRVRGLNGASLGQASNEVVVVVP